MKAYVKLMAYTFTSSFTAQHILVVLIVTLYITVMVISTYLLFRYCTHTCFNYGLTTHMCSILWLQGTSVIPQGRNIDPSAIETFTSKVTSRNNTAVFPE